MNSIESLLDTLVSSDWYTPSNIPGVTFLKTTERLARTPMMYESRIIIVGRWEKKWYLNGKTLHYNADNYLILSIPMSFECEANEDVLALMIDINLKLLWEVISDFPEIEKWSWDIEEAVNAIPLKPDLKNSIIRLLEVASSKEESKILWEWILKEILYRILKDKHGWALLALYEKGWKFARFAQLIHHINNNYASQYTLGKLSSDMAMSETSLFRYFKKYTSQSPLQYIKNIRLQKARDLIMKKTFTLNEISKKVWYKSVSQFSREFHNFFWVTPKKAEK